MNEDADPSVYPLRVEGELDGELSRGLWLVKWVLVIPHVIVLVFLWIAFVFLTVVAFFAILFSGHYPQELSRGLVLVKWWLLALPQYLVVAVFAGGAWPAGGLIGLLFLIAGAALLFSGRYPRSIFDFVMGMNRWAYRVAGYAALMTDEYSPFRLDLGAQESAPGAAGADTIRPNPAAGLS